jgi:hypothetical protein
MQDRLRQLVLFDIGIDSKLRSCDLLACAFATGATVNEWQGERRAAAEVVTPGPVRDHAVDPLRSPVFERCLGKWYF